MRDPRNRWTNRKYNFDNLGQALMALFVLSSKDGWVNIMYTGLDAVGVDQQPIENYNEWRLLYFISFLLLVAFFVLNMFVGVVVENFHRCREEQEKEERARRAEKRARKLEKRRRSMLYLRPPREPTSCLLTVSRGCMSHSDVLSLHNCVKPWAPSGGPLHVGHWLHRQQQHVYECNLEKEHYHLISKQDGRVVHAEPTAACGRGSRVYGQRELSCTSEAPNEMREPPYFIGYGKIRLFIHGLVTSNYFDVVIAAVIGLNVITMSLEYYDMPTSLEYMLRTFNYVFTGVFCCEALMKLYALGFKRYLKERWNKLDVLIVIFSIVGILLEEVESKIIPINPTIIRVMRVARIARVLKLLKMAKGMRALLDTVMQALPQVGNLGLLFYLLFFIFAALGVELFGRLECDEDHPCQGMSEHAHFQNFGIAFLTLFRVATGDNWNGVMKDTLRDQCDASSDCLRNCCVSPIVAPMYFVIFVLLAQFVLVNVVVAVLMKHLEESHKYLEEDEDYEIDMEIARELAAEKKALEEASQRKKREEELRTGRLRRRLLTKVSSLPANFTFTFSATEMDNSLGHKKKKTKPKITINIADQEGQSPSADSVNLHSATASCLSPLSPGNQGLGPVPRKLSDVTIVDEESANISQYLIRTYPEFVDQDRDSLDSLSWSAEDEDDDDGQDIKADLQQS
ncbi:Voltage-dependent T-type calcium channel subunit alpha-1I [Halotydeus destructor]|nr:Voltage-dependent T-type calcium channel subunit alpha-1I [Halotydeus destructor]